MALSRRKVCLCAERERARGEGMEVGREVHAFQGGRYVCVCTYVVAADKPHVCAF